MPLTREQKKWAVTRRAQLALKHAYDRIDYAEDIIAKELQQLADGTKEISASGDSLVDAKKALSE